MSNLHPNIDSDNGSDNDSVIFYACNCCLGFIPIQSSILIIHTEYKHTRWIGHWTRNKGSELHGKGSLDPNCSPWNYFHLHYVSSPSNNNDELIEELWLVCSTMRFTHLHVNYILLWLWKWFYLYKHDTTEMLVGMKTC